MCKHTSYKCQFSQDKLGGLGSQVFILNLYLLGGPDFLANFSLASCLTHDVLTAKAINMYYSGPFCFVIIIKHPRQAQFIEEGGFCSIEFWRAKGTLVGVYVGGRRHSFRVEAREIQELGSLL